MDIAFDIEKTTLEYLGVSENSKIRHILQFFKNYPEIIKIEYSSMANPYHIITYLASNLDLDRPKDLRNRFIVGFLFWTGVRINELLKTRKWDLDLISRTYNVPTLKQRSNRTAYRPIPLTHVPTVELKIWSKYLDSVDGPIVNISDRQMERIIKKILGPFFYPHMLRHGLGLFLYEYTKDIRIVAQILRHRNIANTLIYTRLSLEAIREKLELE